MSVPQRSVADLHILENEAAKRANASPLPGPVGDAFGKYGPITIGEIIVRPIVASDWKIFTAVDSPIIKMLMEFRQNPAAPMQVEITDDEECMLCYQFTRPVKEARETLAKGLDHYKQVACEEMGDKVDAPVLKLIQSAVMEQIKRSWVTAISFKEKLEESGEVTFFQEAGTTSQKTA